MYTAIYRLDTHDIQHDLAHLFEHLVLYSFYSHAKEHGFHPALIGWVSGQTFTNAIYLDVGFYDPKVLDLFHKYMSSLPEFKDDVLRLNLELISAEDKVLFSPISYSKLKQSLTELKKRQWTDMYL